MMAGHKEIEFENELCDHLAVNGWLYSKNDAGYDKERALFSEDMIGWWRDTQPDALSKVLPADAAIDGSQAGVLLDRVVKQLETPVESGGGTLNVLRGEIKHVNARLRMCQFKPESTLNAKTVEDYEKVRVRVMRQVYFSPADGRSIDLVLFVNGLPVATLELKTDFVQSIADAVKQYKIDRLPKDPGTGRVHPLLTVGRGALVHFAVSNTEVEMATKLAGDATRFLPFNRGTEEGGAGNPINPNGSPSSYLWERVLDRDAWLGILGRFMYVKHEISTDPITGKTTKSASIRFPRFHQWEAVTQLTEKVIEEGVGHKYLIQHSAGSGKTDSISWLSHRLARLQVNNEKVFDSVILITDRTVLDAQLQDAVRQLDGDHGIVVAIDRETAVRSEAKSKSGLLAKVLADGKLIIVCTIQTFPFALDEIRKNKGLSGKRFAVIADEAHSSQTGQAATQLKAVLTAEELEDLADGGEIDVEAVLAAEVTERAASQNISYFAFTATPKAKTLELFGRRPDNNPAEMPLPFHVYSMRQAIEEGYIIDVLRGYHSYQLAFQVGQKAETGGGEVDQSEATKQVMRWVKLHAQTIDQKAGIIVEHFHDQIAGLLDGHAKAMVVADSRKAAVRYKFAIDKHLQRRQLAYQTLVAFSGSVSDPETGPKDFTEASMNPSTYDLRTTFSEPEYKVMIVANKFQTGFDQPLLCAMYVDRKLSGVTAVQTLSRLNRTYVTPNGQVKSAVDTQVVDFVNNPADIRDAFEPYYLGAFLETETDPNLVHDISIKLDQATIYTKAEIDACAESYVNGRGNNTLAAALSPGQKRFWERWQAALLAHGGTGDNAEINTLELFRKDVGSFVRIYDFMSQIIDYGDAELEKKAIYLRLLSALIREGADREELDLSGLALTHVKQVDRGKVNIGMEGGIGLAGMTAAGTGANRDPKLVALREVLERLNDLFGDEDFTPGQQQSFIESLLRNLLENETLVQQARVNTTRQFSESPDFDDALKLAVSDNQAAHARMADYFFSSAPGRPTLISLIASAFHEFAKTSV
ncbi:type I restriction endonuclease subunit R [Psychromicrobium sp. YIM B11713]|uniref:type I restriction endonuclease subunit R n=1 Tax=Psychromicrobium sp. YIM B11713 TaxID=3145233 RepID=UPI00374F477F